MKLSLSINVSEVRFTRGSRAVIENTDRDADLVFEERLGEPGVYEAWLPGKRYSTGDVLITLQRDPSWTWWVHAWDLGT